MFTGLVERVGLVQSMITGSSGSTLKVESDIDSKELSLGESIAVSGVCLTVINKGRNFFEVEISPESLEKTSLKKLKKGDYVNIERSLKVGERLGGHIVYGHIDGVATLRSLRKYGDSVVFEIKADNTIMKYIVYKGSIAVNGVSLTVSKVLRGAFEVTVLPYTLEQTNLKFAKHGDGLNIEVDIIGKYVEKFIKGTGDEDLLGLLGSSGFLKED